MGVAAAAREHGPSGVVVVSCTLLNINVFSGFALSCQIAFQKNSPSLHAHHHMFKSYFSFPKICVIVFPLFM